MLVCRFLRGVGEESSQRRREADMVWWLALVFNSRMAHKPTELDGFTYLSRSLLSFGNSLYEAESRVFSESAAFEECLKELLDRCGGGLALKSVRRSLGSDINGDFEVNFEMCLELLLDGGGEVRVGARCAVGSQRSELSVL